MGNSRVIRLGYLSLQLENGNLLIIKIPRNGRYIESISIFLGPHRHVHWNNADSYDDFLCGGFPLWDALQGIEEDEKVMDAEREVVLSFVPLPPGQKFWLRVNYSHCTYDFEDPYLDDFNDATSADVSELDFYCLAFGARNGCLKLKRSVHICFYDQEYVDPSNEGKLACIPPYLRKPL